jgi:SAM-dependent methyltransferase
MFGRLHPGRLLFKQMPIGQGLHTDPLNPGAAPPPALDGPAFRAALTSEELQRYRDALRLDPNGDVRAGILDDLSTYFEIDPDECVRRCIHWEASSVAEWFERGRRTPEGILDFYRSTQSWVFDLLWFAYLQAEGYEFPASVVAAQYLRDRHVPPGAHLDFGSGVGVTSQLFAALGYETHLGDVSTSLLDFTRFRLDRRGQVPTYLDLAAHDLEADRYDVVTAIDTLAHVPDVPEAARQLYTTLRPGGWLFANVDVRAPGPASAWHLHSDAGRVALELQRVGFRRRGVLDGLPVYQRGVAPGRAGRARVGVASFVRSNPLGDVARRVRWPTYSKIRRQLGRRGRRGGGPR